VRLPPIPIVIDVLAGIQIAARQRTSPVAAFVAIPVPLTRHEIRGTSYQRLLAPGGAHTSVYPLVAADAASGVGPALLVTEQRHQAGRSV
jgi:hypothetical protein